MWYVWLILAGVFFIAEIMTAGFLIFWLGLGSTCAMLVSFITDNLVIQTAVFVVSFILGLFSAIPFIGGLFGFVSVIFTILVALFSAIFTGLYSAYMYLANKPAPVAQPEPVLDETL